jgi:hypothetical protein
VRPWFHARHFNELIPAITPIDPSRNASPAIAESGALARRLPFLAEDQEERWENQFAIAWPDQKS